MHRQRGNCNFENLLDYFRVWNSGVVFFFGICDQNHYTSGHRPHAGRLVTLGRPVTIIVNTYEELEYPLPVVSCCCSCCADNVKTHFPSLPMAISRYCKQRQRNTALLVSNNDNEQASKQSRGSALSTLHIFLSHIHPSIHPSIHSFIHHGEIKQDGADGESEKNRNTTIAFTKTATREIKSSATRTKNGSGLANRHW